MASHHRWHRTTDDVTPPMASHHRKADQIRLIRTLGEEVQARFPQFGCGRVLTAASHGSTFGACQAGAAGMCEDDLCRCLGGIQLADAAYAVRIESSLDCILHDGRGASETFAETAQFCAGKVQERTSTCSTTQLLQLSAQAAAVDKTFPEFGCMKLLTAAIVPDFKGLPFALGFLWGFLLEFPWFSLVFLLFSSVPFFECGLPVG